MKPITKQSVTELRINKYLFLLSADELHLIEKFKSLPERDRIRVTTQIVEIQRLMSVEDTGTKPDSRAIYNMLEDTGYKEIARACYLAQCLSIPWSPIKA